tara:strand:- start:81 stop:548 length:468 start_codon:yes stop_codon:yes gene_type:complete
MEYIIPLFGKDPTATNSKLLELMLVKPLSKLLSILGFYTITDGQTLYYETAYDSSRLHKVHIVNSCSGIYSVIVFISAFTAYFFSVNENFTFLNYLQLGLGIIIAYFSNLLRMLIIVFVGIYEGDEALYWTHKNVGWIIFLVWISIFWQVVVTNK